MVRFGQMDKRDTAWVRTGIAIRALRTVTSLLVLLPDQLRMERADPADDATVRRLFWRWSVVGWASTVVLDVAIWAMTTKRGW